MTEFQCRTDDMAITRIEAAGRNETVTLAGDELLLGVDRFAFTANNVTYGVAGDTLGYWTFFPPEGPDPDRWGLLPVWGFADVIAGSVADVGPGERLYGYFPPASHMVMKAGNISAATVFDMSAHRADLPPPYNRYQRVLAEPNYDRAHDAERALLQPLYITSYCLWDALREADWYKAAQIVVLSASAKTSLGLAFALNEDPESPEVIGLTSTRSAGSVAARCLYDTVWSYDEIEALDTSKPTVIVDMSGDRVILGELHGMLGDNMLRSINVGLTHWDKQVRGTGVISERTGFFFAPGHIQTRCEELGPALFFDKAGAFMTRATYATRSWLKMREVQGLSGLREVYPDVRMGRMPSDEAIIVVM